MGWKSSLPAGCKAGRKSHITYRNRAMSKLIVLRQGGWGECETHFGVGRGEGKGS